MKNSRELREFQWASVRAVCEAFDRRRVYALADEVGLGKTLVCAEVAHQLVAKQPSKTSHLIYYVAPSIELLHQNLRSIRGYLEERCGEQFHVWTSISRLSQVPRDFAEHTSRIRNDIGAKGSIHIIGLSPGTSFSLRGAGQFAERIYLAALFGYGRSRTSKRDIARLFWCLNGYLDLRVETKYPARIKRYRSKRYLGELLRFRDTEEFQQLLADIALSDSIPLKQQRAKVGQVRRAVVEFLIKKVSPTLVIFDEWHKYKQTCFKNPLLQRFMAQVRSAPTTRTLFVSATPFSVEFKETAHGDARLEHGGDMEGLLQMSWGRDQYLPHYQRLLADQSAYVEALGAHLRTPANDDSRVRGRRDAYEKHLREYCSRVERPRVDVEHVESNERAREVDWTQIIASGSLHSLLRRFTQAENVRAPVLPMWSDGHAFTSYGYPSLKPGKPLRGAHWKLEVLIKRLQADFSFDDRVHSFRYPPLWLRPEADLRNRKHLIFSEFLFVPEEICRRLDISADKFGSVAKKKWTGSVLGYFPLRRRGARRLQQRGAQSVHFVLFFPFFVFELSEGNQKRRIDKRKEEIAAIIATETCALEAVRKIEAVLCETDEEWRRLEHRWHALDEGESIAASPSFKGYLRFLFFSKHGRLSLGHTVAGLIGDLRLRWARSVQAHEHAEASKAFEREAMRLAASILRLFASPEAQTLKARVRVRLPPVARRWNSHVRFALWYSERFELDATLREFADLLLAAGVHPSGVVEEIAAAIGLRKGAAGTRFVRSFHDRKINDAEYEGDEESVSVKSLRAAFNSPFPPYVLASTSVGQEGLDFHRYCASVIHWSPPSSPSVLRQREGRVDRFQALQIRQAWQALGHATKSEQYGMHPDFVVMNGDSRMNHIYREVWYLPFTTQEAAWKTCLRRMYYNDLLLGAPDPLSDERLLLGAVANIDSRERIARFKMLRKYAVSLQPRPLSLHEIDAMKHARGEVKRSEAA